jgi:hypothetical protein
MNSAPASVTRRYAFGQAQSRLGTRRRVLAAWSRDSRAFEEDLEAFVDNFMRPGNLQGGFNWYLSVQPWRVAAIEGTAPKPPPLTSVPVDVLGAATTPCCLPPGLRVFERFSRISK